MPRGKFSNMDLLNLFRKVEYLALNIWNRTKELIKEWDTNDAHFEHISKKCNEIYESLEIRRQNVVQITEQEEVTTAEKQNK